MKAKTTRSPQNRRASVSKWDTDELRKSVPARLYLGEKVDPKLSTLKSAIADKLELELELNKFLQQILTDSRSIKTNTKQQNEEVATRYAQMRRDKQTVDYQQHHYANHNLEVSEDPLYIELSKMIRAQYKSRGLRASSDMMIPLEQITGIYSSQWGLRFIGEREHFDKTWKDQSLDIEQLEKHLSISNNLIYMTIPWKQAKQYIYKNCHIWLIDNREWFRDIAKVAYTNKKRCGNERKASKKH